MNLRVLLSCVAFLLSTAGILHSQDLADAAKKEKERRAVFKNKTVVLLTNDSIVGLRKKPAVSTTQEEAPLAAGEAASTDAGAAPLQVETSPTRNVPTVSVIQSTDSSSEADATSASGDASGAESAWQRAKEYADLLELKLNSLWLQFYSMNDGAPRELLQQEISAVYEKYTRAREEEARLRPEGAQPREDSN